MDIELRLYKDELPPQAVVQMPLHSAPVRAIYVVSGGLRLASGGATATLGANSAWHNRGAVRVASGNLGAVALRWELTPAGAPGATLACEQAASALVLSAAMALDAGERWLLRCDRVDFPPGGEALLHTHRGGGIRCLLAGAIEIRTGGTRHAYRPLEAWFEAGPDPVYAAASATEATAFARVMVLPRSLLGKSSITYVNAEDVAKPKSQQYQVFIDAPVELPAQMRDS
jgi:quercetin dioxygenase-like cupin family protein